MRSDSPECQSSTYRWHYLISGGTCSQCCYITELSNRAGEKCTHIYVRTEKYYYKRLRIDTKLFSLVARYLIWFVKKWKFNFFPSRSRSVHDTIFSASSEKFLNFSYWEGEKERFSSETNQWQLIFFDSWIVDVRKWRKKIYLQYSTLATCTLNGVERRKNISHVWEWVKIEKPNTIIAARHNNTPSESVSSINIRRKLPSLNFQFHRRRLELDRLPNGKTIETFFDGIKSSRRIRAFR